MPSQVHSQLMVEAEKIIERLQKGERLIAYTAGGVQWCNGEGIPLSPFERPNGEALEICLNAKRLMGGEQSVNAGFAIVNLYEMKLR